MSHYRRKRENAPAPHRARLPRSDAEHLLRGGSGAGFTMLELVIGIGFFIILSGGFLSLTLLYTSYGRILPSGRLSSEVRRIHQITIEDIKKEARQAESIMQSYMVATTTYTTGATTLVLRTLATDSSQNVIAGTYDHIVYYTNTTTLPILLVKRVVPDPASQRKASNLVLNNYVQSLAFTYNASSTPSATKIQVTLATSRSIGTVVAGASSTVEITRR